MLTSRLLVSSSSASLYANCRSASKMTSTSKPNLERMIPKHLLRNPKQALSAEGENSLIKINSSIVAYLENANKHKEFMAEKKVEFELGKRHLANIMGWDAESLTQTDINVSQKTFNFVRLFCLHLFLFAESGRLFVSIRSV